MLTFPVSDEWVIVSEAINPRTQHYTQTTAMAVAGGGAILRVSTILNGVITENMIHVPNVVLVQDPQTERCYIQQYLVYSEENTGGRAVMDYGSRGTK